MTGTCEVRFDAATHDAESIQRAAYRYTDRFTVELVEEHGTYVCRIFAREQTASDEQLQQMSHDMRAEVLDQVLRRRIRTATAPVRNAILAVAFSRTGLSNDGEA
jgi:His-Xaa-Ser system protein HxsD